MTDKAKLPVWTPAPARPGEVVYPGSGLRVRPAPAGTTAIPLAVALQTQDVVDFADRGLAPGVPDSLLALVTTGDFAPPNPEDGVTVNKVVDQVAWVLTYHGSPAVYYGSDPAPAAVAAVAAVKCDFVIVIDGTTSAYIKGFQACSLG